MNLTVKAKHRKAEQILRYLRDIETMTQGAKSVKEACRRFDIAVATYYFWRKKYGEMKSDELVRLSALELESKCLTKIMAEKDLQIDVLKEAAEGNWLAQGDGGES